MKTMSYSEITERRENNIRDLHATRAIAERALREIRRLDLLRRIRFDIR